MPDFSQFIPAHVRKLVESDQSKPLNQSGSGTKPIALNLNENPFGPSPLALKALKEAIEQVHRYPEIHAVDLHEEIAAFHGVKPEQVLVTAGATEFLCIIARVLLGPGLNAATSACSFIVYKLATQVTEGKLVEVPARNNGYDLEAIAKTMDANTRIVFISNPNNPTGTLLTANEIDHFVEGLPNHVLLVLDEAYGDFASDFAKQRGVEYSHALDYVRADRDIIVLKTFSKAHGLAGLRVGYGIGPARLISMFAQARSIFSVSSVAKGGTEQFRTGRRAFFGPKPTRLCSPQDLDKFSFLRCWNGCCWFCGALAVPRSCCSASWDVGGAQGDPCEHWHAGAKPTLSPGV